MSLHRMEREGMGPIAEFRGGFGAVGGEPHILAAIEVADSGERYAHVLLFRTKRIPVDEFTMYLWPEQWDPPNTPPTVDFADGNPMEPETDD